jgi:MGT family glycosyltransferase
MKVLFTVWPYSGHVLPCLSLARTLRSRGHAVAFYTGAAARGTVEREGFACFSFEALADRVAEVTSSVDHSDHPELYARLTERYTSVAEKNPLKRLRRVQNMYQEMVVGTVAAQVADLNGILADWKPDVVLADAFMWGPVLILREKQDASVVVFSFFAGCMVPGPGAPPHGFGLPRPRNWLTRALTRVAGAIALRATKRVRLAANEVRREHGLQPLPSTYFESVGQMPLHLVASSPEYDYERRDLPASVHYVGPCVYDPSPDSEGQTWAETLTSARRVVYVTEGTCQVRRPLLLRAAAEGLGGLPLQVVMTTGRQRDPGSLDLGPLAANVIVHSWVVQSELLPKCSVVARGIPLVVVPMEWDQLENAQRVVEAGAGLRISPRRCSAKRLRAAVERVLTEPSFAENARRIAASFSRYEEGHEAVRLLESMYARRPAAPAFSSAGLSAEGN